MNTKRPDSIDIISALSGHEELIADLYTLFGEGNAAYGVFWRQMAVEERAHADVIRKLAEELEKQSVFLDAQRFNVQAVSTAMEHIAKLLRDHKDRAASDIQAFSYALDMEQGMIEKKFFEVFDSDSIALKREFSALADHTIEHVKKLRQNWLKARAAQQS